MELGKSRESSPGGKETENNEEVWDRANTKI
jgi:hypothetical protein